MLVRGIVSISGTPLPDGLNCDISGTVVERQVLNVQVDCSDASAVVFSRSYRMTPQPGYDEGSSLESIAGNYTIAVRPDTNILNIIADGSIFGIFHNGANCTINGLVSEIDSNYFILTGQNGNAMLSISITYEPV